MENIKLLDETLDTQVEALVLSDEELHQVQGGIFLGTPFLGTPFLTSPFLFATPFFGTGFTGAGFGAFGGLGMGVI